MIIIDNTPPGKPNWQHSTNLSTFTNMKNNQKPQRKSFSLSSSSSSSRLTIKPRLLTPPPFPFPYLSQDYTQLFTIIALILLSLPNNSSSLNNQLNDPADHQLYSSDAPILYKLHSYDQDSATSGGGIPWTQLETSPKVSWTEVLKYYRDNGYVDFNPLDASPPQDNNEQDDKEKSQSDPAAATALGSHHHHHQHHQQPQLHSHHGVKASSSVKGHPNHHHHPKASPNSALYNFLILAVPVIFVPVMALIWVALLASLANRSAGSNPNKMFISAPSGSGRLNKKSKL